MVFGARSWRARDRIRRHGRVGEDGARAVEGLLTSAAGRARVSSASIVGPRIHPLLGATSFPRSSRARPDRIWRAPTIERPVGMTSRAGGRNAVVRHGGRARLSAPLAAGDRRRLELALEQMGRDLFPEDVVILQSPNLVFGFGVTTRCSLRSCIESFLAPESPGRTSGSAPL